MRANKQQEFRLTMSLESSAFIAGGIAACGAVTATHPFETVKIRYAIPPDSGPDGNAQAVM